MDKKKIARNVLIHIGVWALLYLVPILLYLESSNDFNWRFMIRVISMLFGLMLTFYGNILFGIDKLFYRKHYLLFVLFNVGLFFFVGEARSRFVKIFDEPAKEEPNKRHKDDRGMHTIFVFNDVVYFLLGVGASIGIRHTMKLGEMEIEHKKLENETLTSELSLLRYQIQPHFFFNTLNNIYALIGKSPSDAQKSVMNLSKMMRYVLYDSEKHTISVALEIDFLKNYTALMRIRLRKDAKVDFEYPDKIEGIYIPSLVLIPLLENAFKHGISPTGEADIDCRMTLAEGRLRFCVRNETFETEAKEDRSHSGIGLENLRKRMEILYGNTFTLNAGIAEDGRHYMAEIDLPVDMEK